MSGEEIGKGEHSNQKIIGGDKPLCKKQELRGIHRPQEKNS